MESNSAPSHQFAPKKGCTLATKLSTVNALVPHWWPVELDYYTPVTEAFNTSVGSEGTISHESAISLRITG